MPSPFNNSSDKQAHADAGPYEGATSYWADMDAFIQSLTNQCTDNGVNGDDGHTTMMEEVVVQLINNNVPLEPRSSNINGDGDGDEATAPPATANNERRPPEFIPGYRFNPHEPQLITEFLAKRIAGEPLPLDTINEVNLYDFHPSHLVESYKIWGEHKWYFFTSRDRKYLNGMLPQRTTPYGYWKATGRDKQIFENGLIVGKRKALVFYEGNSKTGWKTDWIMHEYITKDVSDPSRKPDGTMKLDDVILCVIQRKKGSLGRGNKEDNAKQEIENSSPSQQTFQENTENVDEFNFEANYDCHNMANEFAAPPISDSVGVNSSIYYPNSRGIQYSCYSHLPEPNDQMCPSVGYFSMENIMHQQPGFQNNQSESLGNGLPDNQDNTSAGPESMELEDAGISDGDKFR